MAPSSSALHTIINILNSIAPFSYAEDWDNVGLMIGDPLREITGIIAGLDPTLGLLSEAHEVGANLIITHHPNIFHPLKNIQTNQPDGAFIAQAINHNIAIIACHTNLDIVKNGVNTALANKIGLIDTQALVPTTHPFPAIGLGLSGKLAKPQKAESFFTNLCHQLDLAAINISGQVPENIERIAICGGSGSEFAPLAQKSGAQVYITGEVKHSTARWAEDAGFCIVDAGHYGTENLVIHELVKILDKKMAEQGMHITIKASVKQQNPFSLFYPVNK